MCLHFLIQAPTPNLNFDFVFFNCQMKYSTIEGFNLPVQILLQQLHTFRLKLHWKLQVQKLL